MVLNGELYNLFVGNKSIDIFNYFSVDELHGLSRQECNEYTDTKDDAYIASMTNYSPEDKKPFVFINKSRLQDDYRDVTLIMHELMHLSLILHKWNIRDKEEDIITWAEEETNKLMKSEYIN